MKLPNVEECFFVLRLLLNERDNGDSDNGDRDGDGDGDILLIMRLILLFIGILFSLLLYSSSLLYIV